ncbi:MAG: prolyl oligopeptidase family serine peptidase, partial [Acidimicrobiales bacterium]
PDHSVLAIRERHGDPGVERSVVCLEASGTEATLVTGRDFFGSLAVSPDGARLAWVAWDHPNMPWDETELWTADLAPGRSAIGRADRVGAEALRRCSVDQPVWAGDGSLLFVADAEGWWQPWRVRGSDPPERLCDVEAEFQGPAWALGQHTIALSATGHLGVLWRHEGTDHVGVLEDGGGLRRFDQPCVSASSLCAHGAGFAWFGATPSSPGGVWRAREAAPGSAVEQVSGAPSPLSVNDVSVAEPLTVPVGTRSVHANFYPPHLSGWHGPSSARPPLVVIAHSGPTGCSQTGFDPVVQMFTTRGFAVAAVDYVGSTGYGRQYRQALEGRWGVADVDDSVAVARWLAESGRVDPERMAIRGSSAGGLTALGALVRSEVFAAAVSWYGVSDLVALSESTHDFESRYLDGLVGLLPTALTTYEERSPRYRVADITGAVLLLQGEDDPVVPASQTRTMADALRGRGLRCEAIYFDGESHGFRRFDTLVACFEAELGFYDEVLVGVEPRRP